MKQIDHKTRIRLLWLCLPLAIVFIYDIYTLIASDDYVGSARLAIIATMIASALPFLGAGIAAVKQKCWGYLACSMGLAVIMYLFMIFMLWILLAPAEDFVRLIG